MFRQVKTWTQTPVFQMFEFRKKTLLLRDCSLLFATFSLCFSCMRSPYCAEHAPWMLQSHIHTSDIQAGLTVSVFLSCDPQTICCIFQVVLMCLAVKVTELLFLLSTLWDWLEKKREREQRREKKVGGGKEEADETPSGWKKEKSMTWFGFQCLSLTFFLLSHEATIPEIHLIHRQSSCHEPPSQLGAESSGTSGRFHAELQTKKQRFPC